MQIKRSFIRQWWGQHLDIFTAADGGGPNSCRVWDITNRRHSGWVDNILHFCTLITPNISTARSSM